MAFTLTPLSACHPFMAACVLSLVALIGDFRFTKKTKYLKISF
jgi:hypothetical protein